MGTAIPTAATSLVEKAQGGLRDYLQSRVNLSLADLSIDGLWSMAEFGERMELTGALLTGLANRELATRVGSRELAAELRARGRTRSAFDYSIRQVEALELLPEGEQVAALARLGSTKLRQMLAWQPDERADFASGKPVRGITLEEAEALPTREFEARAKPRAPELEAAQVEIAKLKTERDIAKQQMAALTRAARALETDGEFPMFVRETRQEAFAAEHGIGFLLDNLALLMGVHVLAEVKHPEAARFQPVIAANCEAVLGHIEARVRSLRGQLRAHYPDCGDTPIEHDHQLSHEEAVLLRERLKRMSYRLDKEQRQREVDRVNSQDGRRGRQRDPVKG